jgi:hypothetical protein
VLRGFERRIFAIRVVGEMLFQIPRQTEYGLLLIDV